MVASASQEPERLYSGGGSTPVPDPTFLTNELVDKANAALREVLEAKIDGNAALVKGQFESADKAIKLLEKWRDELPGIIRNEVGHLKDLHEEKFARIEEAIEAVKGLMNEKFSSVGTQFASGGTALSAALQAQKEQAASTNESNTKASEKMEGNFTKLLQQGSETIQIMKSSLELQINDLKSRLDKGEGRSSIADPSTVEVLRQLTATVAELKAGSNSSAGQTKGAGDTIMWIFGGVGMLVGLVGLVSFAFKLGG